MISRPRALKDGLAAFAAASSAPRSANGPGRCFLLLLPKVCNLSAAAFLEEVK